VAENKTMRWTYRKIRKSKRSTGRTSRFCGEWTKSFKHSKTFSLPVEFYWNPHL